MVTGVLRFTCAFLFAGHATITNYLLNYFPGLDLERRNVFGFTALMKAAMQGRTECIRALMLAGMSPPVLRGPEVPGLQEMRTLLPQKNVVKRWISPLEMKQRGCHKQWFEAYGCHYSR